MAHGGSLGTRRLPRCLGVCYWARVCRWLFLHASDWPEGGPAYGAARLLAHGFAPWPWSHVGGMGPVGHKRFCDERRWRALGIPRFELVDSLRCSDPKCEGSSGYGDATLRGWSRYFLSLLW